MGRLFLMVLFVFAAFFSADGQKNFYSSIRNHRADYKQAFLQSGTGPLDSLGVQGLRFYRPKKAYQIQATFTAIENAQAFEMLTYSGETQPYVAYGQLHFVLKGDSLVLTLYRNLRLIRMPMYRDHLFLPFKDETNQGKTYGGGRYLDLRIGDIQDSKMALDFNKAYNPYCAYSDGYSCPVPPFENHLSVKIKAGEKNYLPPKKTN